MILFFFFLKEKPLVLLLLHCHAMYTIYTFTRLHDRSACSLSFSLVPWSYLLFQYHPTYRQSTRSLCVNDIARFYLFSQITMISCTHLGPSNPVHTSECFLHFSNLL